MQFGVTRVSKSDDEVSCLGHGASGVNLGVASPGRKVIGQERVSTDRAHTHDVTENRGGPLVEPYAPNLPIVVVRSEISQRAHVSCKIQLLSLQNIPNPAQEIQSVSRRTPQGAV